MGYVEQNLISGEQIAYRSGLHWIVLLRAMVIAALLGLLGVVMLAEASQIKETQSRQIVSAFGVVAIVIGAIYLLAAVIRRNGAEFAVTNKRVIFKTGVMRRSSEEIFLSKVESVTVDEGLLGRALNYGTINVRGTGGTLEPFHKIAHAQEFRRHVQEQISKNP
jgi:uncharacterized membrane protein YdbT with pleckstrin-like domain